MAQPPGAVGSAQRPWAALKTAAGRWRQAVALEGAEDAARRRLLATDPEAPIEAQLETFLERLLEMSKVDPTRAEGRLSRARAVEVFLRLESVQARLAAMSTNERRTTLARVRARFGYSPQDIARLESTDWHKDARWDNGLAYMTERAAVIAATPAGTPRDAALEALRARYFDHEAETIAREEASGFFRFRRRRVYGRN